MEIKDKKLYLSPTEERLSGIRNTPFELSEDTIVIALSATQRALANYREICDSDTSEGLPGERAATLAKLEQARNRLEIYSQVVEYMVLNTLAGPELLELL